MLNQEKKLYIASADGRPLLLEPAMSNRHGLVAGATGTGKTVTLQTMAEGFSALGVPVFLTDVKGDLSGMCRAGQPGGSIAARIADLGLPAAGYVNQAYPVCFWDVFGASGHPLRATVSSLGPLLFSRLLDLNEVQSGIMHLIFRIADDKGLLLLDLKDLRSMTTYVGENRNEFKTTYGNITTASIGAIQRGLLRLEEEGAENFFGEPALMIEDLFLTDLNGRGQVHILAADKLMRTPRLYSAILLWLLSDLYERLPEVGDQDRPRLVLMFDEAHLIFSEAPSVLLEKLEQVVRLIRSKGVGVYFITQNPADVPPSILSQLGNRVQHALRAFTPQDQKAVKAAAQTFRPNPAFKTEEVITSLSTGEALVSFLDGKGAPTMVERAMILPPEGQVGPVTDDERRQAIQTSRLAGRYDQAIDRESAYELLAAHFSKIQDEAEAAARAKVEEREAKEEARRQREAEKEAKRQARENPGMGDLLQSAAKRVTNSFTSYIGREVGRQITRGILGGLFGGKKK
ncbi:DUF853 domain-containing protein [Deltaproteobacteria bacterium Smac51]|nr:DUF853 domain-containing protein [Deltaproteobacteria bacterium Smac51]